MDAEKSRHVTGDLTVLILFLLNLNEITSSQLDCLLSNQILWARL